MAGKDDKGSRRGDAAKIGASASKASAKASAKSGQTGPGPGAGKRGRGKPAPVKKPFPVGFAAGVAVLVLLLGGILVYAATNVGSGFDTALDKADKQFSGLRIDDNLTANHINPAVGTRVDYPDEDTRPPDGGNHNPFWYKCAAYTAPLVQEHAVHSLEHGAVWITYKPDTSAADIKTLTADVAGNDYALLSPYLGQTAPVMATAWGRQLSAQSVADPQIKRFVSVFADGPQTREKGAGCSGIVNLPGTVPFTSNDGQTAIAGPANGPHVPAKGDLPKSDQATPTPSAGASTPAPVPSLGGTVTPTPAITAKPVVPKATATAPAPSKTP